MTAIAGTLVKATEFSGEQRLKIFTATIISASDDIDLSSYFSSITACFAVPTGGVDNDFQTVSTSVSGTTVTVTSYEADGAAADEFTGTTIQLWVIGY